MSHDTTIRRAQHDRKNPYVMVNKGLITNPALSPQCRWLLIFLLSHPNDWEIKASYIQQHLEGHKGYGRQSIRFLIKEAVSAGYMAVEYYTEGNLRRLRYLLYEEPQNSKNVSDCPVSGCPEHGRPQSGPVTNELEELKNYNTKEEPIVLTSEAPSPFSLPKNSRKYGTNPRALGTNPKALGTNPRAKERLIPKFNEKPSDVNLRIAKAFYEKLETDCRSMEMKVAPDKIYCATTKEYIYFHVAPDIFLQLMEKNFRIKA